MGTKKWWGVWMFIGNIPQVLRVSQKKKRAAVLLGQIPEVRTTIFHFTDGL